MYKNNVSLIPRLNASIAFPCLVLNVYCILVSTFQNILFRLPTGSAIAGLVDHGTGVRRTPDRGFSPISRSSEWRRPSFVSPARQSPPHVSRAERCRVMSALRRSTHCRCEDVCASENRDGFAIFRFFLGIGKFRNYRAKPHICSLSVFNSLPLPPTP